MKALKALILGLLIIFLILFVVQNLPVLSQSHSLRLNLLFASFTSPPLQNILLFAVCLAIGFIAAFAVGLVESRRLRKKIKELELHLARREEELRSLRNLPITGPVASNREGAAGEGDVS